MGRKDLTETRRNQILDAFERCIVELGISGATLTKVAEVAQINRGMIHHYIGDRNNLVRLVGSYREEFSKYLEAHKDNPNVNTIVEYFFEEWSGAGPNDDVIIDALVAEAAQDSQILNLLLELYSLLENTITAELRNIYPNATEERCHNVAYAIMSMAYGSSTMMWLGFDRTRLPEVRSLVKTMIQTLEEDD